MVGVEWLEGDIDPAMSIKHDLEAKSSNHDKQGCYTSH